MPKHRTGTKGREGNFLPTLCSSHVLSDVEIHRCRWSGSPSQNGKPYMLQSPSAKILEL